MYLYIYIYIYIYICRRLGGESAGQHPPRTGKSFRFVRACVRAVCISCRFSVKFSYSWPVSLFFSLGSLYLLSVGLPLFWKYLECFLEKYVEKYIEKYIIHPLDYFSGKSLEQSLVKDVAK